MTLTHNTSSSTLSCSLYQTESPSRACYHLIRYPFLLFKPFLLKRRSTPSCRRSTHLLLLLLLLLLLQPPTYPRTEQSSTERHVKHTQWPSRNVKNSSTTAAPSAARQSTLARTITAQGAVTVLAVPTEGNEPCSASLAARFFPLLHAARMGELQTTYHAAGVQQRRSQSARQVDCLPVCCRCDRPLIIRKGDMGWRHPIKRHARSNPDSSKQTNQHLHSLGSFLHKT